MMLNEYEYHTFTENVDKSGMTRSDYIRALIVGHEIRAKPKEEWAELIRQISALGNNVNQLAHIANTYTTISPSAIEETRRILLVIWDKVKGL